METFRVFAQIPRFFCVVSCLNEQHLAEVVFDLWPNLQNPADNEGGVNVKTLTDVEEMVNTTEESRMI